MSRTTTATFKAAVFAPETSEAFVILLTIDHADLAAPIRVCSDGVDTVSRGDTFVAFPFQIELPDDAPDRPPRARLAIDNVDRRIVQAVRAIASAATVLVEIVKASDPDTVEVAFEEFALRNIGYDAGVVQGDLVLDSFEAEPYPAGTFSPADFPGLF